MDKPVEPTTALETAATGPSSRSAHATTERAGLPVDNDSDLAAAWQRVVDDLQPNQRAWLQASEPVTLHESTAIIAVADDFTRTSSRAGCAASSRTR